MNCLNCGVITTNPKFCSRSCSASYNNSVIGARHGDPERFVCECGDKKDRKSVLCHKCNKNRMYMDAQDKSIDDLILNHIHPRFKYNEIRKWAKRLMEHRNTEKKCINCNYSLHVECCHIKPISEFTSDTKMIIVNSDNNLIYLCRNCHWEFDNGYLKL